jgi:uridine kinase
MKIIAIAGGSGSGKSFFVNLLKTSLPSKVSVLALDNYYKPRETQVLDENGIENFDLPSAFDIEKLVSDLKKLQSGETIRFKQYNYNNAELSVPDIIAEPADFLLLEGIFVLSYPQLASLVDYKIFIDVNKDLALKRRLKRDFEERGYDETDVLYRFHNHAYPAYEAYILPHKAKADVVFSSDENIQNAINNLIKQLLL